MRTAHGCAPLLVALLLLAVPAAATPGEADLPPAPVASRTPPSVGGAEAFPAELHFQVEDIGVVVRGTPWRIRVTTNGPAGVDHVILYWASGDSPRFQTRLMDEAALGDFEVRLPGAETNVSRIRYYFTAWDPQGRASAQLGSAGAPLELRTDPGNGARALAALGIVAAVVSGIVALGMVRESSRRRRDLDRLFWFITLRELVALDVVQAERELRELAGRDLCHPVLGPSRFPAAALRRRLAEVRLQDASRLLGGDLLGYRTLLEQQRRVAA